MDNYETAKLLARLDQIKATNEGAAAEMAAAALQLHEAKRFVEDALESARAVLETMRQEREDYERQRDEDLRK